MNEALHILKNIESKNSHNVEKLNLSNMKDMKTIIEDTKKYLLGVKNAKSKN